MLKTRTTFSRFPYLLGGQTMRGAVGVLACSMMLTARSGLTPLSAQDPSGQDDVEVVVQVRIHILASEESSNLNCGCSEAQITAWFDEVNSIWEQAAIRWEIESFVHEEAKNARDFDRMVELGRDAPSDERRTVVHSTYPLERKLTPGWNVFFIHRMAFGAGVYNGVTQSVLIGETSPRGAINPSILAHELGHSLGLRHSQERFNLMSGRQPGVEPMDKTRLSPEQIAGARAVANSGDSFRRDRLEREKQLPVDPLTSSR